MVAGWRGSRVLVQEPRNLRFKPLPRHLVMEVSSSLIIAPADYISIMLLRPVKWEAKCTAETTNKNYIIVVLFNNFFLL